MPSHREVAHAWAHQTGKQRKGFNMFYVGATIYSYGQHFPIARLTQTPSGETVVLHNAAGYSVSTAKHKAYVRGACSHMRTFEVPLVNASDTEAHIRNYEHQLTQAKAETDKAKRARKHGDWHLEQATRMLNRANAYAAAFELDRPRDLTLATFGDEYANITARLEAARIAQEEARLERERQAFERDAERRAAWLAGKFAGAYWHGTGLDGSALLRVNGDELQTSQGASVPLAHAVKAFRFAKLCRETGTAWNRNGKVIRVGHFTVDRIDPARGIHAGCHFIAWSEVYRIAGALGIADAEGSREALEDRDMVAA
jgi:hypothetical protein